MKKMSIRLSDAEGQSLKSHAAESEQSQNNILRLALRRYLESELASSTVLGGK